MDDKEILSVHIRELEKKLLSPEIRRTPLEIDKLLADDFFEFGSSGNVWYKKDAVCDVGLSIRDMTLSNFEINPLSENVVLATYRVYDRTREHHTLRSSIWKLIDGKWQMFFHQGTITKVK